MNGLSYLYNSNFLKLYSFWSVWDVDFCLLLEQPHLPCYCGNNELSTYLAVYPSYEESVCHYVLNESHLMIWCLHLETCDHFWYHLFCYSIFQYLYAVISHLVEHHEIDMMTFVARCFSWAFSSLFLHVLTHVFDFVYSWLCIMFQVFSLYWRLHMLLRVCFCLLQVSYLLQFQTVWVLDICVLWQPKPVLMETVS